MSYRNHRMGNHLLGISNCPHCGISAPLLMRCWSSDGPLARNDGGIPSRWAVYRCNSCGHIVSAKGRPNENVSNALVDQIFPDVWQVDEIVPARVRNYLHQAHQTLASPDASVVMAASSIDAMLKDNGLTDGSLYSRIEKAVADGILTQNMAEWAHRVRLDSNNPRHADEDTPHMSIDDARRAFDFANALTEYLYLLPSRMPPKED